MYRGELKKIDYDFIKNSYLTFSVEDDLYTKLLSMNSDLGKIDELLVDGGVETIDHSNLEQKIYAGMDMLALLVQYSGDADAWASKTVDYPFKKNLSDNAYKSITDIKVDEFSTENTLGIKKQAGGSKNGEIEYVDVVSLTLSDFLGINSPKNNGKLANVPQEFLDFNEQYVSMYETLKEKLVDENGKQIEFDDFLYALADRETPEHQLKAAVSMILDATIIKPIIEAAIGKDLITGDKLSDLEREIKVVCAVVGVFSLGSSAILEMPAENMLISMGKVMMVDMAATTTTYGVSRLCEELGLPAALTIILAFASGVIVAKRLNKLVFEDVNGNVVYEADETLEQNINNIQKKTPFKYLHNPSDNPKVLEDAVEDPTAVYGYRPKKGGSLDGFAGENCDWSDPVKVAEYRRNRILYHNRNEVGVQNLVDEMFASGASKEEVAEAVCNYRNESRIKAYLNEDGSIRDMAGYQEAVKRAEKNSYQKLLKRGKTPDEIIESATRGNPGMDACTGLYDEYYDTYKIN